MEKKKFEVKYINGFTQSAWKSLTIKSLRIGWVNGIEEASKNLTKSELTGLLVGSLFEDVFPIRYKDLDETYLEIRNGEWEKLCSRNTLHGRGYAQQFFDMAEEACQKELNLQFNEGIVRAIRSNTSLSWINPRVYNCLYTWYKINPEPRNYEREPLISEWKGMPKNILDGHTFEGKRMKSEITLLSGHYENHLEIGNRVMVEGWNPLRQEFLKDDVIVKEIPKSLFD
jgi:hypothetical protein